MDKKQLSFVRFERTNNRIILLHNTTIRIDKFVPTNLTKHGHKIKFAPR